MNHRWKISLHESGHAVAASRMLAIRAVAVLLPGDGGCCSGNEGPATGLNDAVVAQAGPSAECLASRHAPPDDISADMSIVPAMKINPGAVARLTAEARQAVPDAAFVANWCTLQHPTEPIRWRRRYELVQQVTREFISKHELEIIDTARRLFRRGIAVCEPPELPAEQES